jgi:hypothetical protein
MFIWLEWFLELLGIRHKKEEPVQTVPVPHPEVVEETVTITTVEVAPETAVEDTITVEEPAPIVPDLQSMTKAQLVEYGASVGLALDMKMKKAEMLEALK